MRLLNSTTYELKEFFGKNVPKYAILSHRWEDGEVSFQDLQRGDCESKAGYGKIRGTCTRAATEGHDWVWIDTCCIDKTSSAELSEAINSMFAWYKRSQICYAYLSDVPPGLDHSDHFKVRSAFRQSLWFQRGWTLQELIAPEIVVFLNREWESLGYKHESQWINLVAEITGISTFYNLRTASVAQKMSWLSKRQTTRVEDMAYCMLGIFGVFMSPIYGEEDHAFHRLQLEILKISDDESIFAWKTQNTALPISGLLAHHPGDFRHSNMIIRNHDRGRDEKSQTFSEPYSMTNKGLAIKLQLKRVAYEEDTAYKPGYPRNYEALLNCWNYTGRSNDHQVCIYLLQSEEGGSLRRNFTNQFARLDRKPTFADISKRTWKASKYIPGGVPQSLVYVSEPTMYSNETLSYGTHYIEVDILGSRLQERLSHIGMDFSALVEPRAFEFKIHMQAVKVAKFYFKLPNSKPNDLMYILVSFWARGGRVEVEIRPTKSYHLLPRPKVLGSAPLYTLRSGTIPDAEESGDPREDLMLAAMEDSVDIAVSQPVRGIFHYKIWHHEDVESREALQECKYENLDGPQLEGLLDVTPPESEDSDPHPNHSALSMPMRQSRT